MDAAAYPDRATAGVASAEMAIPPKRGEGGIPAILTTVMDRLDAYIEDTTLLPGLNAVNGSQRQQRLERRIACLKLLKAHIKYLDLVSLRVGVPCPDGAFLNLTLKFLAKHAGLPLRRAERAMHDLQRAGLVTVRQQCERNEEGEYRGLAGMRFVPAAVFGVVKLAKWLRSERAKARARRQRELERRRRELPDERGAAHASLLLAGVKSSMSDTARRAVSAASICVDAVEYSRRLQQVMVRIYTRHPDRGRDWAYEQAAAELRASSALLF